MPIQGASGIATFSLREFFFKWKREEAEKKISLCPCAFCVAVHVLSKTL